MKNVDELIEEFEVETEDQYFDLTKNAPSFEELQDIIQTLGYKLDRVENICYH